MSLAENVEKVINVLRLLFCSPADMRLSPLLVPEFGAFPIPNPFVTKFGMTFGSRMIHTTLRND